MLVLTKINGKKNRYFYHAEDAQNDYCKNLVESRQAIEFDNYSDNLNGALSHLQYCVRHFFA